MLIGIDMGGTHIDGVAISKNKIIKSVKHVVDHTDLYQTILNALNDLISDLDQKDISRINLSTTISTNSIVEQKISEVDLILQKGPGINYEFPEIDSNLKYIDGYVDHRGKMVKDLNKNELEEIKSNLNSGANKNLAVVTKFSTRNPEHEQALAEYFADDYFQITQGHTLSGRLNFPRRVNTAYLNSAVYNTFQKFALNIEKALAEKEITAPIYILKADGGTMHLKDAIETPVETILSGPAASFMGMSALFDNQADSVLLDIGGTTTDIFFLVDGLPVFEPAGISIDQHKTLVRAIYSVSIGLGGDSKLSVSETGSTDDPADLIRQINIGPEREGAPLVFGGPEPTLTDAMVILGQLEQYSLTEEQIEKSEIGIAQLAKKLNLSKTEFSELALNRAAQIIKEKVDQLLVIINSQPVYTVREVLADRQIKPIEIKVIGGPAEVFSSYLEQAFDIEVKYPNRYEIANAIGAALAQPTLELNLLADTQRKILIIPELNIYQKIGSRYSLSEGRTFILDQLNQAAKQLSESELETEIVEESSFNMVDGFKSGKNIRIKAQIKPGLSTEIEH